MSSQPKKLLDQVCDVLRAKAYSIHTEHTYVDWIRRFILFHKTEQGSVRHPLLMGAQEINAFLTHLAVDLHVAAHTQNQAASALIFLYRHVLEVDIGPVDVVRAQIPQHRPHLLTREQIRQVIDLLKGTNQIIARLLYGAGLRLIECLRLRVGDLDFDYCQIVVRDPKGRPSHLTILPLSLRQPLQAQLAHARALHQQDLAKGFGAVYLPPAVVAQYPDETAAATARSWRWQYLFPASRRSVDPRSGLIRRHRLDQSVPQKALRAAAQASDLDKRVTCRTLRDAFAAHLLQSGYDVRTVQELLGHKDVDTTLARYTHILNRPAPPIHSPLDL